jgi:DEAD/DEAH box helicase domain-containing protein
VPLLEPFFASIESDSALRDALLHHEREPARAARFGGLPPESYARCLPLLERRRIPELYSHQARALALLEAGGDVVLATPTASGKSLIFTLPILRDALADPNSRALLLFPLKALEQDQAQRLRADAAAAGALGVDVAIYDGDTPESTRRRLRERPPQLLISTPDMLHAGILPHHATWQRFFSRLRWIVVDELHTYRGVFGSHVAQVLRRLLRVARFHGAEPRIIAASATVANPEELATALAARPFEVVQESGAPRAQRHFLLFRPKASPYTLAAQLFRNALSLGLRTIAFTKARVITELMHTWVAEAAPVLAPRISSYRAGFLPGERREIEQKLFSGELLGVISTSALEMGIDVGGLDVCILVGYPGSQVATWQRSGRVGRSGEAAVALVAQPDALDQYLVTHPQIFFTRGVEHAVLDPHNAEIAAAHLPCAAAELPLREGEAWLSEPGARANLERLEAAGALLRSDTGAQWFAAARRPHREVSLRQIGASYAIALEAAREERPTVIGSIGAANVFSECHEGAIYLHRGKQYLVTELDSENRSVRVRPVNAAYYTRALSEKQTSILSRDRARPAGNFRLLEGRLRVTTTITGYERRRVRGQDLLGSEPLSLPPTSFETVGIWLEMPEEIPDAVQRASRHPMGGIHAMEHAALALFPLFALCDRHDVGGISYVRHPELGKPAVFFYDGHPGGVGIASSLFERVETLLEATLEQIRDCECEAGCPACVHSPKCGSGNRPIDKAAAIQVLRLCLALDPLPAPAEPGEPAAPAASAVNDSAPSKAPVPRVLYFDLETQRGADEVGGWHNAHLMRVALAVIYDTREERFETFAERDVPRLLERLAAADLVVGFNVRRFDYQVLRGYTDADFEQLRTFDVLDEIHRRIGFRLPLGHLAEETLGASKSADGRQSLLWWKQGRVAEIEEYCRQDVALLRDLVYHALEKGFLCFRTRAGERVRIPTRWTLAALIEAARARASEHAPKLPLGISTRGSK